MTTWKLGLLKYSRWRRVVIRVALAALPLLILLPAVLHGAQLHLEAHAAHLAHILEQRAQARPSWTPPLEATVLIVIALLVAVRVPKLTPLAAVGGVAALACAWIGFCLVLWTHWRIVLPLTSPLACLLSASALVLSYTCFFDDRRKRRWVQVFSQHVPPEMIRELDAMDTEVSLDGETREMSVLFSDVRGFSTLSEGIRPRELTRLMNELLTPLTEVIQQQRGAIDKYMGDAIMAFWGAPLPDRDHGQRAVQAALSMVQCSRRIRAEFAARGWPEVHIGIGISSGLMTVGDMGSKFRMAYTVLGDAVNLGARLESLTRRYGVEIIVSGATARLCPDVAFRELDLVQVQGKREPVAIYEPLGPLSELAAAHRSRLEHFSEMLGFYRSGHFQRALELLSVLAEEHEEPLIALYRQRVAHFLAEPPPGSWDGVFVYQTK